jgi:ribosomal protein L9
VLDNFKPAPPKRPNNPNTTPVSDQDVLASFGADSTPSGAANNAPETPKSPEQDTQQKEPAKFRVKTSQPSNKKRNIIIIGVIVGLLAVLAGGYWWTHKNQAVTASQPTTVVAVKKVEKPKIYSPLTGVEVATPKSLKKVEVIKSREDAEKKIKTDLLLKNFGDLKGAKVEIEKPANEQGHLFAQIHKDEIINAVKEQTRLDIETEFLLTKDGESIKTVGEHEIEVKIGDRSVTFTLSVKSAGEAPKTEHKTSKKK